MLAEYTRINDDDVDLAQTKVDDLMMTILMMAIVMITIVMMNETYNAGNDFKLKSFSQRTLELLMKLRRRRRNTGMTRHI